MTTSKVVLIHAAYQVPCFGVHILQYHMHANMEIRVLHIPQYMYHGIKMFLRINL